MLKNKRSEAQEEDEQEAEGRRFDENDTKKDGDQVQKNERKTSEPSSPGGIFFLFEETIKRTERRV